MKIREGHRLIRNFGMPDGSLFICAYSDADAG
jgi:hypothetical protein